MCQAGSVTAQGALTQGPSRIMRFNIKLEDFKIQKYWFLSICSLVGW